MDSSHQSQGIFKTIKEAIGKVESLKGQVIAINQEGEMRPLIQNSPTFENDIIKTGPESLLAINLLDGTHLALGQNAQAILDSDVFDMGQFMLAQADSFGIDAIQQAIIDGADPTSVTEETAAGNETTQPVEDNNEGHNIYSVDLLGLRGHVDSGFETAGISLAQSSTEEDVFGVELDDSTTEDEPPIEQPPEVPNTPPDNGPGDTPDDTPDDVPEIPPDNGGGNEPPILRNDENSVKEDTQPNPVGGNVLDNDFDPDNDPLTVTKIDGVDVNGPTEIQGKYGTLTINPDGTYSYELDNTNPLVDALNEGDTLLDEVFTYSATDGNFESDANLYITIHGTNDGPTANPDFNSITEDEVPDFVEGNILSNDTDVDNDQNELFVVEIDGNQLNNQQIQIQGQYGVLTINPDGTYNYQLDNDHPDVDGLDDGEQLQEVFNYTMSDGMENAQSTLTITIDGISDSPPLLRHDENHVKEDTQPNPVNGNVLDNDQGDNLTVTEIDGVQVNGPTVIQGKYGTLTINTDGSYSYELDNSNPVVDALNEGDTLNDEIFVYKATDGNFELDANLKIVIHGTNDAPIANPDVNNVTEDSLIPAEGNVLDNDSDVDGPDALVVESVDGNLMNGNQLVIQGDYGTLTINADGSYSYELDDSNPDVNGLEDGQQLQDVFDYTITDGIDNAQSTLTININGVEDSSVIIVGSNDDDTDANGTPHYIPDPDGQGFGPIVGSDGADILIGDHGGVNVQGEVAPGNYSFALLLDTSGSMKARADGTDGPANDQHPSRLTVAKEALIEFVTQLAAHEGTVNLFIQPFSSNGDTAFIIEDFGANPNDLADAIAFINSFEANGWTNYEDPLSEAQAWMQNQAANNDFNKVVNFISDGEPNVINDGDGYEQSNNALNVALNAINDMLDQNNGILSGPDGVSINAIGIGEGVSQDTLDQIDNTDGADIINNPDELQPALFEGLPGVNEPVDVGGDDIQGGGGNDLIFGDVPNTDALAEANNLDMEAGSGFHVFEELGWTNEQIGNYLANSDNWDDLTAGNLGAGDNIDGGSGHDIIFGQGGNDIILGGSGNDLIAGGDGSDTITGGSGEDTYLFNSEDTGTDTITDFAIGDDILDLSDLLSGFDPQNDDLSLFVKVEGGALLIDSNGNGQFNNDPLAILNGVNANDVVKVMVNDNTMDTVTAL